MHKETTVQCPDCEGIEFIIRRQPSIITVRDWGSYAYTEHTTECASCGFQFVLPEQARDHDRQIKEARESAEPYLITYRVSEEKMYNPSYGDDRVCICGHKYYRHFDTYDRMHAVGCKYCICDNFIEEHDCSAHQQPQQPGAGEPIQPSFCRICGEESR